MTGYTYCSSMANPDGGRKNVQDRQQCPNSRAAALVIRLSNSTILPGLQYQKHVEIWNLISQLKSGD